jgi:hypothetical protein
MTLLATLVLLAAEPAAAEIMARLAENQKQAVELRRAIVYQQQILARMHRGNNKLARENDYTFSVAPTADSFERERIAFRGKLVDGKKEIAYDDPEFEHGNVDIDGNILHDLAMDMTGEEGSRDGLSEDMFPLTAEKQRQYVLKLHGREDFGGRDVYKITFHPRPKQKGEDFSQFWEGEVLVDAAQFQPVLVTCHQAKGIPLAVKILLGTDIKKTGFKVAYRDFGDGLWFPEKYSGEFEFRVLFGYHRKVSISMVNSGLKKAQVDSSVKFADTEDPIP